MSEQRVRWLEEYCHVCGRQLNSWDARVSKALGYKHKLCERCIADEYAVVRSNFIRYSALYGRNFCGRYEHGYKNKNRLGGCNMEPGHWLSIWVRILLRTEDCRAVWRCE